MPLTIDLPALLKSITETEAIAAALVADEYHGHSQFAAGIRGNLAAARDLLIEHTHWTKTNPATVGTSGTAPAK